MICMKIRKGAKLHMYVFTITGNLNLILLSTAFDDCSCANVYVHTYIRILTTEPESGTEHRMSYFMPSFL